MALLKRVLDFSDTESAVVSGVAITATVLQIAVIAVLLLV
jgi:hypothetical protein